MSGMLGVTGEGGKASNSAGEVTVSSRAEYTGGVELADTLLGPEMVGVSSHSEPPLVLNHMVLSLKDEVPHFLPRQE